MSTETKKFREKQREQIKDLFTGRALLLASDMTEACKPPEVPAWLKPTPEPAMKPQAALAQCEEWDTTSTQERTAAGPQDWVNSPAGEQLR